MNDAHSTARAYANTKTFAMFLTRGPWTGEAYAYWRKQYDRCLRGKIYEHQHNASVSVAPTATNAVEVNI